MSRPTVIRTGLAFCVLASIDCFSCFTARSVFTDYRAGGSSRSIPLADPRCQGLALQTGLVTLLAAVSSVSGRLLGAIAWRRSLAFFAWALQDEAGRIRAPDRKCRAELFGQQADEPQPQRCG